MVVESRAHGRLLTQAVLYVLYLTYVRARARVYQTSVVGVAIHHQGYETYRNIRKSYPDSNLDGISKSVSP